MTEKTELRFGTPGGAKVYDPRKPDIIEAMSALLESLPEDYESVEVRSTRGHSLRLSR